MKDIILELYHGMIHPEEEYQPTEEIKALRKRLDVQQRALMERIQRLDPNMVRDVDAMLEEENAVDAMEMEDAYIRGMRMGARLALALLGEKAQ